MSALSRLTGLLTISLYALAVVSWLALHPQEIANRARSSGLAKPELTLPESIALGSIDRRTVWTLEGIGRLGSKINRRDFHSMAPNRGPALFTKRNARRWRLLSVLASQNVTPKVNERLHVGNRFDRFQCLGQLLLPSQNPPFFVTETTLEHGGEILPASHIRMVLPMWRSINPG